MESFYQPYQWINDYSMPKLNETQRRVNVFFEI